MRSVEHAIQMLNILMIANLEEKISCNESIYRALRVMRFTIHTGFKMGPFELHQGKKPRVELANTVKDDTSFLLNWKTIKFSVAPKQNQIYAARNERGDVTNHIMKARNKLPCCSFHKLPKRCR